MNDELDTREQEPEPHGTDGGGKDPAGAPSDPAKRRNLLLGATAAVAAAGAAAGLVPFVKSLNPSAEIEAQRTSRVDISQVAEGTIKVATWQGRPLFVVHRTAEWIRKARSSDGSIDPQPDSERVKRPEWLIVVGVCTHLGCVPNFTPAQAEHLWLCPCHGSLYDFSARVVRGPAPRNLEVPPYRFISDSEVLVG